MKYTPFLNRTELSTKRECSTLSVFDNLGNMYTLKINCFGQLEILTLEGDLEVVLKTSNSLILNAKKEK